MLNFFKMLSLVVVGVSCVTTLETEKAPSPSSTKRRTMYAENHYQHVHGSRKTSGFYINRVQADPSLAMKTLATSPRHLESFKILSYDAINAMNPEAVFVYLNHRDHSVMQDSESLVLLGVASIQIGKESQGINYLQTAEVLDGRNVLVPLNLGVYHLSKGDSLTAGVYFNRVLSLDPKNVPALVHSAEAFTQLGQLKQAEERLKSAERLEPQNAQTKMALAQIQHRRGLFNNARQLLESVLANRDLSDSQKRQAEGLLGRVNHVESGLKNYASTGNL